MSGDLSAILLLVLAVAGVIMLVELFILKPRRVAAGPRSAAKEPAIVSLARSALPVLLFVLLFRSFLFEPFRIPSASMMPGLVDGDFILVNKFTYGLRLPIVNLKFVDVKDPQRGEVAIIPAPAEARILAECR